MFFSCQRKRVQCADCNCATLSCRLCLRLPACSCKLGLGEGAGALDFGGPGEEVLRAAMAELEARNRALQKENARLHVEVVGALLPSAAALAAPFGQQLLPGTAA